MMRHVMRLRVVARLVARGAAASKHGHAHAGCGTPVPLPVCAEVLFKAYVV